MSRSDNIQPTPGRCAVCGRELVQGPRGRRRVTCSDACKQELYRRRRDRRRGGLSDSEIAAAGTV